jgi:hypothetical protein
MTMSGLRPIRGRRDIAHGDGDNAVEVPANERIVRVILAEPGDRVLVALVIIRANVEVAGRRIHSEPLQFAHLWVRGRPRHDVLEIGSHPEREHSDEMALHRAGDRRDYVE